MGAAAGNQLSDRRYRRRVLGWGAAALFVTFAVGSTLTLARVEDDLHDRVTTALAEAGAVGVTVSFDGQDGTATCATPPNDPDAVLAAGAAVRGVRTFELGAGCSGVVEALAVSPSEPPPTATTSTPATTVAPEAVGTTSTLPDVTTVLDILVDDPRFSVLENALETVDLGEVLSDEGPVTIFAPTDGAFAELGPNFNAGLATNPEALAAVLRHHIVTDDVGSADLADGPLVMLDGTTLEIARSAGIQVRSGDIVANVIDPDIDVMNGTVHVIDQVLLPEGLDFGVVTDVFTFVARYENGRLILAGDVADAAQRDRVVAAAGAVLDAANVVDQLVVDAEAPVTDADIDSLVRLIDVLPRDLVLGEAVLAQDGIFVSGVYVDPAALTRLEAVTTEVGASTALAQRGTATAGDAIDVERRMNEAVTADPIRFEPASAALRPGLAILDRLAALAKSVDGLLITIEGHTDSDGLVEVNLQLSQARADAVLVALVARGVPEADLVAVGLGSTQPVLVAGVEDKAASRRVEFVVEKE